MSGGRRVARRGPVATHDLLPTGTGRPDVCPVFSGDGRSRSGRRDAQLAPVLRPARGPVVARTRRLRRGSEDPVDRGPGVSGHDFELRHRRRRERRRRRRD